jgi:DNA-directed RNA polymerase specialized sigma24 family protein
LQLLCEIDVCSQSFGITAKRKQEILFTSLFASVVGKLRDTVDVYLEEHAYRCKFRERMRDKEQYIETTPSSFLSCEFEDVLLQMTDLSSQMDCLSEKQRRRLVKHVFLKYTLQEIADQEGVGKSKIQKSVADALKKLRVLP